MSKQTEAKVNQKYTETPTFPQCRNCAFFKMDVEPIKSAFNDAPYMHEKNMRCGVGGFKVKKLATCDMHKFAE